MKKGALDKKDKEDPTSSRRLSHSEAFLVASLLSTAQSEIRLTPETSISGRTLSKHRLFGPRALYLDLKPLVEVNAKYAPKFTKVCNGLVATFDARQARQVEFLAVDVKGYPEDVIWNCDSVRLDSLHAD